ncbi:MAG TPA: hypothetical protein DCK95_01440 [Anaerolineaceae bacterium]|uniref:Putative auto-transporter adhesin head GIN domain-containing protein n=1 Tax=Anaerolinea thermophila TaxID=167964 RepID=A0A101FYD5_9CHLR|nr:MAG: Uncharacterized protein XD73_0368 [Anaerolinea thermophila]HAF60972.1 hypothetical protein [Anaerolineaceae bacterium]
MQSKFFPAVIVPIFIFSLISGCTVGVNRIEQREIGDISAVSINTFGEFIIKQGDEESLIIEGPNNLLRNIETEVVGNTLYINSKRGIINGSLQKIVFTLTIRDINEIALSGAGSVNMDKLNTDHLEIILTGAGSIQINALNTMELTVLLNSAGSIAISGIAQNQDVILSGVGSYNGGDLQSRNTSVTLSGAGSAELQVSDTLNVNVSGVGSVAYYGSPSVNQNISGLGSVTPKGAHK